MVTNMMEIQCRLQSAVEALTCPLRKTDLRFLCAWLTQMHFSEDHTPAYTSATSAFETLQYEFVCIHCIAYTYAFSTSLGLSLSLSLFFKHWLAINVTFLDTWCFAYAKQIPHYMIVMINKLISNSVKLNTLFFLGCGCLVNSAKQTNFELRLFSPPPFLGWDWRMKNIKIEGCNMWKANLMQFPSLFQEKLFCDEVSLSLKSPSALQPTGHWMSSSGAEWMHCSVNSVLTYYSSSEGLSQTPNVTLSSMHCTIS